MVLVGGAGGIGKAVCQLMADAGGACFLIGRTEHQLEEVGSKFGFKYCVADAANWVQLEHAFDIAAADLGEIQASVNLAGSLLLKPAHLTNREDWDRILSQNLTTAFGMVRSSVARMSERGGSVVLMSSAAASIGLANHEAIAAVKSGIEGLTRSAAATYSGKQIRFNAVAPGLVQTPLTEKLWSQPLAAEASRGMHPLGKLGDPHDVARAILWLASPEQSWVTGQVIGVDGGLSRLKTQKR